MPSQISDLPLHTTAVIAATYNQPQELELCLISLLKQTKNDFYVYIADDGSGEETAKIIKKYQDIFGPKRLVHVWQEDNGFQKSKILNKTVSKVPADVDWLIFLDTDSFVHPNYVEDHVSMKNKNSVFLGRRTDLGESFSIWCLNNKNKIWKSIRSHSQSFVFVLKLVVSSFNKTNPTKRLNRGFRMTSSFFRTLFGYNKVPDLLGSNFSICPTLYNKIGGFDESFVKYWGEDSDLYMRALESGAISYGRKCWAIQYHLWHPRREYPLELEANYQKRLLEAKLKNSMLLGRSNEPHTRP